MFVYGATSGLFMLVCFFPYQFRYLINSLDILFFLKYTDVWAQNENKTARISRRGPECSDCPLIHIEEFLGKEIIENL